MKQNIQGMKEVDPSNILGNRGNSLPHDPNPSMSWSSGKGHKKLWTVLWWWQLWSRGDSDKHQYPTTLYTTIDAQHTNMTTQYETGNKRHNTKETIRTIRVTTITINPYNPNTVSEHCKVHIPIIMTSTPNTILRTTLGCSDANEAQDSDNGAVVAPAVMSLSHKSINITNNWHLVENSGGQALTIWVCLKNPVGWRCNDIGPSHSFQVDEEPPDGNLTEHRPGQTCTPVSMAAHPQVARSWSPGPTPSNWPPESGHTEDTLLEDLNTLQNCREKLLKNLSKKAGLRIGTLNVKGKCYADGKIKYKDITTLMRKNKVAILGATETKLLPDEQTNLIQRNPKLEIISNPLGDN